MHLKRTVSSFAVVIAASLILASPTRASYLVTVRSSIDPGTATDGRVVLLDDNGATLSANFVDSTSLDGPAGLAIGGDGKLYVANTFSERILRFDASAPNNTVPEVVLAASSFLDNPTALRLDSLGNLFIANSGNYNNNVLFGTSVAKIEAGTNNVSFFGMGHFGPDGLRIDAGNNVHVSEYSGSLVAAGGDGVAVRTFNQAGTDITSVTPPTGLLGTGGTDVNNGVTLIPSVFDDMVYQYNGVTTTPLFSFASFGLQFIFPTGVTTVDSDTILVGSSSTATIFRYDYPTINDPLGTISVFANLGGAGTAIGDVIFTNAVPEPSGIALFTVGAVAMAWIRRNTRRRIN